MLTLTARGLSLALGLLLAPPATKSGTTPPRTVRKIDLAKELLGMYGVRRADGSSYAIGPAESPERGTAFLSLCARRTGEEGERSFGTEMTLSLSKARPAAKAGCLVLDVEAALDPWVIPVVKALHPDPIAEFWLLTDDTRWFLFTSYSSTCCESFVHHARVQTVDFVLENAPPNPQLFVGMDGCAGSLFESEECEACETARRRGLDGGDAVPVSVERCVKRTDPSIVTWTTGNGSCFIDYGKCLKER